MAKQKKKRTKKYTGSDAATIRPSITRVSAVHRSPTNQWIHDHQRIMRTSGIAVSILVVIILIVSGIMSLF